MSSGGSPTPGPFVIRLKGEGKTQHVPFMVDDLPENFVPIDLVTSECSNQGPKLAGKLPPNHRYNKLLRIRALNEGQGGEGQVEKNVQDARRWLWQPLRGHDKSSS